MAGEGLWGGQVPWENQKKKKGQMSECSHVVLSQSGVNIFYLWDKAAQLLNNNNFFKKHFEY